MNRNQSWSIPVRARYQKFHLLPPPRSFFSDCLEGRWPREGKEEGGPEETDVGLEKSCWWSGCGRKGVGFGDDGLSLCLHWADVFILWGLFRKGRRIGLENVSLYQVAYCTDLLDGGCVSRMIWSVQEFYKDYEREEHKGYISRCFDDYSGSEFSWFAKWAQCCLVIHISSSYIPRHKDVEKLTDRWGCVDGERGDENLHLEVQLDGLSCKSRVR